jgi:hypothetical protein
LILKSYFTFHILLLIQLTAAECAAGYMRR